MRGLPRALCVVLLAMAWATAAAALQPSDLDWVGRIDGLRQISASSSPTRLLRTYRVLSGDVMPRLLREMERRGWRVRSHIGMSTERAAVVAQRGTLTMSASLAPGRVMSVIVTERTGPP